MEKQIEVEYIGKISNKEFDELKSKFGKEGIFKKKKERLSFMYFRDKIPKDITEIKGEDTDLRIRVTNKHAELIIKKGLFTGAHARNEIAIDFPLNEIQRYIDFLSALNWNIGVIYAAETLVYAYKDIEFSLVQIENYGYNFEAEILTQKDSEKNVMAKITKVLNELGLKPFDSQDLNKQCNQINNRKEFQFNFSKQSFNDIKERFQRFF